MLTRSALSGYDVPSRPPALVFNQMCLPFAGAAVSFTLRFYSCRFVNTIPCFCLLCPSLPFSISISRKLPAFTLSLSSLYPLAPSFSTSFYSPSLATVFFVILAYNVILKWKSHGMAVWFAPGDVTRWHEEVINYGKATDQLWIVKVIGACWLRSDAPSLTGWLVALAYRFAFDCIIPRTVRHLLLHVFACAA